MSARPGPMLKSNVSESSISSTDSRFKPISGYRPLCAGHRGFKASYPENTIAAMRAAIEAGATIIETDIQVSGDGVVVVTHDPNSFRCFGVKHDIPTTPYHGVLNKLLTTMEPREPMPTFEQIARLFAESAEFSQIQLMLDVKRTNEPGVITKVVSILREVNPDMNFWGQRMVFGIWREDVLAAVKMESPEIPVVFIGVSKSLARRFMAHDQVVGISLHHIVLSIAGGSQLVAEAKARGRLVYSWTINSDQAMRWAISANLDGVITDTPDVYNRLLERITDQDLNKVSPTSLYSWTERFVKFPLAILTLRFFLTLAWVISVFTGRAPL
ncbi:hypothetical protein TRVA0_005S00672 [Trichomonascus vanleenenianus]|uniref:phosphatidylglycerol phospholipase n=1 Tax=Trichomonascus vanleenenianus TaxID=2268995 RepID=UPI003ECA8D9F